MKPTICKITLFALTTAAAALLTSCGTTAGYKQAEKTGVGIAEFRDEIESGKKAITETTKALDEIAATATTNPRKAFEQFSKSVSNLESVAAKAKKRSAEMQAQGQAYFKQWEQQLSEVKNAEVVRLAQERRSKLQETFAKLRTYSEPLKAQFDPWMSDLKDLQKFLSQDLTITGVDSAKGLFAKAKTDGAEVQKSIDGLVSELNSVAATLTPMKVAPPK